jgi:hypothetical protein
VTATATRLGPGATRTIGWLAVVGSVLYFLSDVIESVDGGFSTGQLWLTLVAEAVIPIFVIGLALAQQPRLGRLGMVGAIAYAYAYVYFTGTVVYALVDGTADFDELNDELGWWMTAHGAVMLLGGLALGFAVARAGVLPRWTGVALMLGVVLVTLGLPDPVGLVSVGVRDLAFAGMGLAVLRPGVSVPARAEAP